MTFSDVFKQHQLSNPARMLPHFFTRERKTQEAIVQKPLPAAQVCPDCGGILGAADVLYTGLAVCDHCGHHFVWSASERLNSMADPATFRPISSRIQPLDFLDFIDSRPYKARLAYAQEETGLDDAIIAGRCCIGGVETVIALLEFRFMGGSMGSVMGEQISSAFEFATRHHLPVVIFANSGGARMQEGILSLVQMAKTSAAIQRFHRAGLFYLSILCSPTTGGVYASFASLGDIIVAEPGALIGFAGPRVVEQATGQKLPPGTHSAEFLLKHGQLDTIVTRQELPRFVADLLQLTTSSATNRNGHHSPGERNLPQAEETSEYSAWEKVHIARHADRPTTLDYIHHFSPRFMELHGDRYYGDDPAIVAGLGEIEGHKVVFVGQERRRAPGDAPAVISSDAAVKKHTIEKQARPRPEGYRKALRMMELAARLGFPLVTLVDTAGADPGMESEQRGLASAIAHCLAAMSSLAVPIVTVLIGEGGSGGALALAVADKVLMLQHAVYELIAPEGAAAILYRDAGRAEQVASQLRLTAPDCLQLGVVDDIVPEPAGGAHTDPQASKQALQLYMVQALTELEKMPMHKLLARRYQRFRHLGRFEKQHPLFTRVKSSVPQVKQGGYRQWLPRPMTGRP